MPVRDPELRARLEAAMARSADAERLLNDTLFTGTIEAVRDRYIAAWTDTKDAQERERERLWLMVKLLDRIFDDLASMAADGRLAADRLGKMSWDAEE